MIEPQSVNPLDEVELEQTISVSPEAVRLSIQLHDVQDIDRSSLGDVEITKLRKGS